MKSIMLLACASIGLVGCGGSSDPNPTPQPIDCNQEVVVEVVDGMTTTTRGYWEGDTMTPHSPAECKMYARTVEGVVDGDISFFGEYMEHGININMNVFGGISSLSSLTDKDTPVVVEYRDSDGKYHRVNDSAKYTSTYRDDLVGNPYEPIWYWYGNGRLKKIRSYTYEYDNNELVKIWHLKYMQNEVDSDDYSSSDHDYIKQIEANLDPAYLIWF